MKNQRAFTLVELSIVLVILGLLVGGVLAGQSLIHAAELRAITTEYTNYRTAFGAFREKYMALPGDMPNAVRFWGAQTGGSSDGLDAGCVAETATPSGTETCNGDGNGKIGSDSVLNAHEWFRSWQHLSNAGLVEGNFTGVPGPANSIDSVVGTNIPRSRFPQGSWSLRTYDDWTDLTYKFAVPYGNILTFGAQQTGDMNWAIVLKAEDAYVLDSKIDDGKPGSGMVLSGKHIEYPNCIDASNTDYAVSSTAVGCNLGFRTGY